MNLAPEAIVFVALLFLLGLIVGSFLNVVIARVPEGGSLIRPASHCPGCGAPIRARDNVPVVSWLILRGKCRDCGEPISAMYPLVELTTGLIWAVLGVWALQTSGQSLANPLLPVSLALASAGIALTVIDVRVLRLPNAIVLPLYPIVILGLLLAGVIGGSWPWWESLCGAGIWLIAVGVPWLISGGRWMGAGDVKLAPILGAVLGWQAVASAGIGILLAFVLGALMSLGLLVFRRASTGAHVPFGPFLLAGAFLALLFGQVMWEAYLTAMGVGSLG